MSTLIKNIKDLIAIIGQDLKKTSVDVQELRQRIHSVNTNTVDLSPINTRLNHLEGLLEIQRLRTLAKPVLQPFVGDVYGSNSKVSIFKGNVSFDGDALVDEDTGGMLGHQNGFFRFKLDKSKIYNLEFRLPLESNDKIDIVIHSSPNLTQIPDDTLDVYSQSYSPKMLYITRRSGYNYWTYQEDSILEENPDTVEYWYNPVYGYLGDYNQIEFKLNQSYDSYMTFINGSSGRLLKRNHDTYTNNTGFALGETVYLYIFYSTSELHFTLRQI